MYPICCNYAQLIPVKVSYIHGIVQDNSTGTHIPYAYIYNESMRKGYTADLSGKFIIPGSDGDTLVITAVGFYGKIVQVSSNMHVSISLTPCLYEIDEVKIFAFRDYHDFKDQFLALEIENTPARQLRDDLFAISRDVAADAETERMTKESLDRQPGEFVKKGFPIYSREEKQMLNYAEVLKKEKRQRAIYEKYNRQIVFDITHLPEEELTDFMSFCNFSEEYLYQAGLYEILLKIEEKFREYIKMKENGSLEWIDKDSERHLS